MQYVHLKINSVELNDPYNWLYEIRIESEITFGYFTLFVFNVFMCIAQCMMYRFIKLCAVYGYPEYMTRQTVCRFWNPETAKQDRNSLKKYPIAMNLNTREVTSSANMLPWSLK